MGPPGLQRSAPLPAIHEHTYRLGRAILESGAAEKELGEEKCPWGCRAGPEEGTEVSRGLSTSVQRQAEGAGLVRPGEEKAAG